MTVMNRNRCASNLATKSLELREKDKAERAKCIRLTVFAFLYDTRGNRRVFDKRETGIEPATPGLGSRCSTIELLAHNLLNQGEAGILPPILFLYSVRSKLGLI